MIGTGRSSSEDFARSLGVDEFIAYERQNAVQAVKAAHPDGIDAALDLVDDADAIKALAEIVRPGGSIVSTIRSADVDWFAEQKIAARTSASLERLNSRTPVCARWSNCSNKNAYA